MLWLIPIAAACCTGFILFRRVTVPPGGGPSAENPRRGAGARGGPARKLSVVIPARDEERNLPHLLQSLRDQTLQPDEIIVVDDFSADGTRETAERFGVAVIANAELPPGWTGKNWAVWNGYLRSTGDLIVFLDADIRLAPAALEELVQARDEAGGVVSAVPYHFTENWRERLALVTNILGIFAFTSPFEKNNPNQGLYGSCILTTREDYEKVSGHESVKSEVLDDLNLGARYRQAGLPVTNFIGYGRVSFRMYGRGIRSAIEGFAKGAVLSTSKLSLGTVILAAVWLLGLLVSESALLAWGTSWLPPLGIGYLLYTMQIFYFAKYTGRFGFAMPLLNMIPGLLFILIMVYSLYQVTFVGSVTWKGRQIKVGGR